MKPNLERVKNFTGVKEYQNMNTMNPRVDLFLSKAPKWQSALEALRMICLECMLTEELKWDIPVYSFRGKNIVGINGLKESCALSFFKGSLLNDAYGILIKPGEHTQAGRWIKFTSVQEVEEMGSILKDYIYEAVEVEKAGLKIIHKKTEDYPIPEEFQHKLETIPALNAAFESLTPGRQRAYLLYFSAPKLPKTRQARIVKCMQQILDGKGLNDPI